MVDQQMRSETDSMGSVEVPADRYWGAQTERARHHFAIGRDPFPLEIIRAVAEIKRAAATANAEIGVLDGRLSELIRTAADEIIAGRHDGEFPLHVWMTGSGTQANMNVNEVISNRAIELAGGARGSKDPVHPNDHVNRSQSSNDVIPTALNVAAAVMIASRLLPALANLREALAGKARQWRDVVKIGRTHMQDAVPMTLGQEFAGYVGMLDDNVERLAFAQKGLMRLAIGGTAVGTGLNAPAGFDIKVASELASRTGLPFEAAANKFAVMGAHDAMVMASGTLRVLAVSLHKIANDIRLLACGPRAGFAELVLPENEPGSSIMPGKVNPTQCEALAMLTVQVMGLDAATGFAGAGGLLDMNVYKPMIGANVIESCRMLADGMEHFAKFAVAGMEANESRLRETVDQSLMLVTALTPEIGYDKAAAIAHHAHHEGLTLREAALALGHIDAARFDRIVDPASMTGEMPDIG